MVLWKPSTWFKKSDHQLFMDWLIKQTLNPAKVGLRPVDCYGIALSTAKIRKCENPEDLQRELRENIKSAPAGAKENFRQTLIQVEMLPKYVPNKK